MPLGLEGQVNAGEQGWEHAWCIMGNCYNTFASLCLIRSLRRVVAAAVL
jgi:hypothetical protein